MRFNEKGQYKRSKRLSKGTLIALLGAVAAVILSAVTLINSARPAGASVGRSEDITRENTSETVKKGRVNILIGGRDRASGLYDAIMLASFDRDLGKVFLLQLPRDTYMRYTDDSYKKLNGAPLSLGGMSSFCELIENSLGIGIDHYVSIDLDTVREAVDALGGVEIYLPFDMSYTDNDGERFFLPKGKNTIDGKGAELILRYRSGYATGDLGRLDAQKLFLSALFCRLKNGIDISSLLRLADLADELEGFESDMGVLTLVELAKELKGLEAGDISFATLPGEAAIAEKSGASYYVLSMKACEALFDEFFDEHGTIDPDGLFLNEGYSEFRRIYFGHSQYRVYTADSITKEAAG